MASHFSYEKVEQCMSKIENNIKNIGIILNEPFTVTSLSGSTVGALQDALNKYTKSLEAVQEPLTKMNASINDVRQKYIAKEEKVQSSLS